MIWMDEEEMEEGVKYEKWKNLIQNLNTRPHFIVITSIIGSEN